MPSKNFVLIVLFGFCTHMVLTDCPRLCECKWKNGKESTVCLNASLSVVPLHLDVVTQILDLTGNNLVTLKHDEFSKAGLLNLQKIYISKCRLKSLERYCFRNLNNLVELDLSYNTLTVVPSHTFDSIIELRDLKLNGNPIQKISNDAFVHIPNLVRLDLSECRLVTIETRAFYGLEKSLQLLKLDRNKLKEVQSASFMNLQSLNGLELSGNPWNCSCVIRPLREWMLRQNVPFGIPPVCNSPRRLFAKPWDKLELDEYACIPEIIAFDSKAHGIEGKNITMTCYIVGIPQPNIRWLLRNRVIANMSGSTFSNGRKLYMVHQHTNSTDLTIFSADLQDAGTYTCSAENKAGKAEASVTLAISKKNPETSLSNKIIGISVITGVVFVLISCIIALTLCTIRRKEMMRWNNRECRREDNYEKIEMNQKVFKADSNGGVVQGGEVAIVSSNRRNGDYRVVPGADTDHEGEDEDEGNMDATVNAPKSWSNYDSVVERRWNSPEHLLDPDDLHIPRRTLQEARDDLKKTCSSTSGTSRDCFQSTTSISSTTQLYPSQKSRRVIIEPSGNVTYTTNYNSDLSSLTEDEDKKIPDLIENSSSNFKLTSAMCVGKANSEGGSISDINELFCTLPRKRTIVHSSRYRSSDSQSPLLPDSRYGSSGGESSYGSHENNLRRLSDSSRYPLPNLNRNRVNKISNSFLNLTHEEHIPPPAPAELNSTPLLDISGLESRYLGNNRETMSIPSPSAYTNVTMTPNANSIQYHTAQLEKFLEEYRTLQKELTKARFCRNEQGALTTNSPITPCSSEGGKNSNNMTTSPNSNQSLEDSIDFRNFESELTRYLLAKNSPSNFSNSGMFQE